MTGVHQVWLTALLLAISNSPAVAIVLDVDDPSECSIFALSVYPESPPTPGLYQVRFVMLQPRLLMACNPSTMVTAPTASWANFLFRRTTGGSLVQLGGPWWTTGIILATTATSTSPTKPLFLRLDLPTISFSLKKSSIR